MLETRHVSSNSDSIHILFADSTQLRAQLITGALRRRPEFTVTPCMVDADAVLQTVASAPVDVLVLASEQQTSQTCLAIIRSVHIANPDLPTVLLVDLEERDLVVDVFRSGARGIFCYADMNFRKLCKCIHCVHEGQVWANAQQLRYLLAVLAHVPSLRVINLNGDHLLTGREEQVVALVADGLTNRVIASELGLSEHTIKKYLFRIFDKLGISTRVELVLYAMNHGTARDAEWIPGS
jgi:DNA-binding NarL/FixJ family response regulator